MRRPLAADPGRLRLGAFVPAIRSLAADLNTQFPTTERVELAVVQPRYGVRGWNGAARSPVAGVEKILDEVKVELGSIPIALIGHSMGGRIAAILAGRPEVVAVVGLAPWWPDGEGSLLRPGLDVLVLHGQGDHVVDPSSTRRQVEEATGRGVRAEWQGMPGGHGMLRGWHAWHAMTADFVVPRLAEAAARR